MKQANRVFRALTVAVLASLAAFGIPCEVVGSPISPAIRSSAMAQAKEAVKTGGRVCVSSLINHNLPPMPDLKGYNGSLKMVYGNIALNIGGRNFTAADIDRAQVSIYTLNGPGLSPLLHDGGEWPGTGGDPNVDDGNPSFGVDWAGEIYDLDGNGHFPKAVLRYIGSHCYIFVPVMNFPTLPRGISATEEVTPAAKAEWGMYWYDTGSWGGGPYYYAPTTGARSLEPRFVLGADKNLARLKLKSLADEFDSVIYPKMREYFGVEPDIDGDSKIFIFLDDIRDGSGSFRGYFWAANQYPRTAIPQSNQKELLYVDMFPSFALFPTQAYTIVAHEFVHLIHFNEGTQIVDGQLVDEERWLEEGFAQYGEFIYNGKHPPNTDVFIRKPDTILVDPRISVWLGRNPFANYGAAYLFMFYLMEQYGATGATFMRNFVRDKARGVASVNNALRSSGTDMNTVFSDWTIANYLNKTRKLDMSPLNDGKWGYHIDNDFNPANDIGVNESLPVRPSERVILGTSGTVRSAGVNHWAADYIHISGNTGNLNIGFDGDDRTQFKAAVIKQGPSVDPSVEYIYLNEKQAGNLIIQNYGAGNTYEHLVLVPKVIASGNYEEMNYVYSASFADLKVAVFPNPVFENHLHILVRTDGAFANTPRVEVTYDGHQGYLVMSAVDPGTYITNYALKSSGEGLIEAWGTTSNGVILTNRLKFTAVYYPPKSEGLLRGSFATLDVPAGALRNGGVVVMAEPETQISFPGLENVSRMVDVGLPSARTDLPIEIAMPVISGHRTDARPAGLFRMTHSGLEYLGRARIEEGIVRGAIEMSGAIFAAYDVAPPTVKVIDEAAGHGAVALKVVDLGSGVDPESIEVLIGSVRVPFTFDPAAGRLLVRADSLAEGRHNLHVTVFDRLGNRTAVDVSASSAGTLRASQVITFPNPAKNFANIKATFSGNGNTALTVNARIFDASGEEVTRLRIPHQGNGVYQVQWNLANRNNRTVGNGVYFVEVDTRLDGRDLKKRLKLAVVR